MISSYPQFALRRKGNKVHLAVAVDTLWHILVLCVTPANKEDRVQVSELVERVQGETGQTVEIAFVDQGYTRETAADAPKKHGIKLHTAKNGIVLLSRCWVVERSFGWVSQFRRLARDDERLPETLAGLDYVAFVILMLRNVARIPAEC